METTPKSITTDMVNFLQTLGIKTNPVYLPFTKMSSEYFQKHCLSNCEAENYYNKSPIIYGWVIWEDPQISFIEAEFHAVIQQGFTLLDITPRTDREEKILFAVDPNRTAKRINNNTWETWTNHISRNGIIESTKLSKIKTPYFDKLF